MSISSREKIVAYEGFYWNDIGICWDAIDLRDANNEIKNIVYCKDVWLPSKLSFTARNSSVIFRLYQGLMREVHISSWINFCYNFSLFVFEKKNYSICCFCSEISDLPLHLHQISHVFVSVQEVFSTFFQVTKQLLSYNLTTVCASDADSISVSSFICV